MYVCIEGEFGFSLAHPVIVATHESKNEHVECACVCIAQTARDHGKIGRGKRYLMRPFKRKLGCKEYFATMYCLDPTPRFLVGVVQPLFLASKKRLGYYRLLRGPCPDGGIEGLGWGW